MKLPPANPALSFMRCAPSCRWTRTKAPLFQMRVSLRTGITEVNSVRRTADEEFSHEGNVTPRQFIKILTMDNQYPEISMDIRNTKANGKRRVRKLMLIKVILRR